MLPIASSELIQMLRNRSVLITGFIIPLVVSAGLVWQHEAFARIGSLGYVAALIVFNAATFSLYATNVTTLASRRQTLFLKRLRSTSAGDAEILFGLSVPIVAVALIQAVGTLLVLTAVSGGPGDPLLLVVAGLATIAMMLGLALATAGLTSSPEHATVTTLPISLGAIAVATWVGITGTEELTLVKRLLPGGSATEMITDAWNGGSALSDSLLLLAPTLAWVAVAVALAFRLFRWEPRR